MFSIFFGTHFIKILELCSSEITNEFLFEFLTDHPKLEKLYLQGAKKYGLIFDSMQHFGLKELGIHGILEMGCVPALVQRKTFPNLRTFIIQPTASEEFTKASNLKEIEENNISNIDINPSLDNL